MRILLMCPKCGSFVHPSEENKNKDLYVCDECNSGINRIQIDFDAELFLTTEKDKLELIKEDLYKKYLYNNSSFDKEAFEKRVNNYKEYLEEMRQRHKEYKSKKNNPSCPKCGSTALSANKKGFGLGKAVAGGLITGGAVGLLGGFIGSRKVEITCLSCGHRFKPGDK